MSAPIQQTRANHARLDPLFHFLLLPGLLLLLGWAVVNATHHQSTEADILVALLVLSFITAGKARGYALRVQDRVIRLEERLRLSALISDADGVRVQQLTEGQLVALRFASDVEAPTLAARVLKENLAPKAIKAAIQNWRGDYFRV